MSPLPIKPPENHFARIRENENKLLVCDHLSHTIKSDPYCPAIDEFIRRGMDSKWIKANSFVAFFAITNEPSTASLVEIGPELGPGFADMRVTHKREVGGHTYMNLGIWNKGEGRYSIRSVMQNMMRHLVDPRDMEQSNRIYTKCPNPAHTSTQQFSMLSKVIANTSYKSVCLFNMIFEKMCTECLALVSSDLDGLAGVQLDA